MRILQKIAVSAGADRQESRPSLVAFHTACPNARRVIVHLLTEFESTPHAETSLNGADKADHEYRDTGHRCDGREDEERTPNHAVFVGFIINHETSRYHFYANLIRMLSVWASGRDRPPCRIGLVLAVVGIKEQ